MGASSFWTAVASVVRHLPEASRPLWILKLRGKRKYNNLALIHKSKPKRRAAPAYAYPCLPLCRRIQNMQPYCES